MFISSIMYRMTLVNTSVSGKLDPRYTSKGPVEY